MANVFNMITGEKIASYPGLNPVESVLCAYEQNENNNYNHWNYDYSKVEFYKNKVYLDKYVALKS